MVQYRQIEKTKETKTMITYLKPEFDNAQEEINLRKKRKFRAMTNSEFCTKWLLKHKSCTHCPLVLSNACFMKNDIQPCKVNGKYILIEVE